MPKFNFSITSVLWLLIPVSALGTTTEIECRTQSSGAGPSYEVFAIIDSQDPKKNVMGIAGGGEFGGGAINKNFKMKLTLAPDQENICKVTLTDADGGPAKVTLNVPSNLKAGMPFKASIDDSGSGKILKGYENLRCEFAPYVFDSFLKCQTNRAAEVVTSDIQMEVMDVDISRCDRSLIKNCIDKPDPEYCFVPVKCWLKKNGREIKTSEFAFCSKDIFLDEYPDEYSRIKACGNDKSKLTQRKLENFMNTPLYRDLQVPKASKAVQ